MQIKLVINPRTFKHLVSNLGEDRVSVISIDADGYPYVSFEIRSYIDALHLLHAGQDSGLDLAWYGPNGKPEENKVEEKVA